ncbi:MAG: GNAT family N-acetyltransferase [Pseudonocardia sp.]|nr:GNAT family N-acetyltransferase [Pseudonocardia sp.]
MTTLLVRERTEADIPCCADALVAVHAVDGYPVEGVADPQAWLRPSTIIQAWVAELDGHVVGHVLLTEPTATDAAAVMWLTDHPGEHAQLAVAGRLFVHPEGRGHSLGRRLMQAAFAYAEDTGLRVALDVMEKDQVAIGLYEKLGLLRIGTAQHDDGHGNLIPAICYVTP